MGTEIDSSTEVDTKNSGIKTKISDHNVPLRVWMIHIYPLIEIYVLWRSNYKVLYSKAAF